MSVSLSVSPHSPTFLSGVLHQCAVETCSSVCVLNSIWESREGEGKQHFHKIMGRKRMGYWQPTQWDLDFGSVCRADSNKKNNTKKNQVVLRAKISTAAEVGIWVWEGKERGRGQ